MIAIALTFLSYIALLVIALSVLFFLSIFLFESITITLPNKHIIQVNKK